MKRLILLLLLTGCAIDPFIYDGMTPADARAFGVDVPDGTPITGKIVEARVGTYGLTERECNPKHERTFIYDGCAVPAEGPYIWPSYSHRYRIFVTEKKCAGPHEAAHALFEQSNHTVGLNIAAFQGQRLVACGNG